MEIGLQIARKMYEDSLVRVAGMDLDQLRYMSNLSKVHDHLSDGLECDHTDASLKTTDFKLEVGPAGLLPPLRAAMRDPFSTWKPWSGKSTTLLKHDIICLHTMVGTLSGSWSWASGAGRSYWHYGINAQGVIWQCQDLRYRSAANLNGNWHVIPIETSDIGEGVFPSTWQDPLWTAKQIDSISRLVAWLCVAFNIPPVLIPDTAPGRRGIAYHRQGISPWLKPGCERWSSSVGKPCPARRVQQLTDVVIPKVQAIVNPPPKEWDEMATRAEIKAEVKQALREILQEPGEHRAAIVYLVEEALDRDRGRMILGDIHLDALEHPRGQEALQKALRVVLPPAVPEEEDT